MHLVYVTHEYPKVNPEHGGIGTFILNISSSLVERGVMVTVIGRSTSHRAYTGSIDGVSIRLYPKVNLPFLVSLFNILFLNITIAKVHLRNRVDIIETQEGGLFGLVKLPRIKYIIRLHGGHLFFSVLEDRIINRKKAFLELKSLKNADAFIGVSKFVLETTRSLYAQKIFEDKPFTVIPNPIKEEIKTIEYYDREDVILYVGTLCHKKGLDILIKAFSKIVQDYPQFDLVIVGRDTKIEGESFLINTTKRLSAAVKSHIKYLGQISNAEVLNLMSKSKICAFPSRIESFGIVAIEGMNSGAITIFMNEGPGPEIIKHGITGFLHNHSEDDHLVTLIQMIINSPVMSAEIAKNGRKHAMTSYGVNNVIPKNINFYQSICQKAF